MSTMLNKFSSSQTILDYFTATCYRVHLEIGYWVTQTVMVQNKQENCADFPYKPLLQLTKWKFQA